MKGMKLPAVAHSDGLKMYEHLNRIPELRGGRAIVGHGSPSKFRDPAMTAAFAMPRIAFLDDDHVMRVVRGLLLAPGPAVDAALAGFFAPEAVDLAAARQSAAGLREQDGAAVTLATTDPKAAVDATVLAFRRGAVTAATMDSAPGLRLIQRLGARPEGIDLAAAERRGIAVSCLPRRSLALTAEHAVLLMLALAKRLVVADAAVRAGPASPGLADSADRVAYNWPGLTGLDGLSGRTLGIVGMGEVGTLVAARANAFGMRVLYTKRTPLPPDREAALNVSYRPLGRLMEEADFVSVHVQGGDPLTPLVGREELSRMRPGAFLVNTSRGRFVDEDALYETLAAGRIAGAGLDVHAVEPRPGNDRFCRLDTVILTPHVSGGSRLGVLFECAQIYENIRAALAGKPPLFGAVTP